MDDNQFWLNLWRAVIAGLCVVVATMAGCTSYKTRQAADLIRNGADPIRVGCALEVGDSTATRCLLLVTK
jgi:hypothetical protein